MADKNTIEIIGRLIEVISITITAYFASRSLNAWRIETSGKRKFELAEQILVSAYRAKDALAFIRNPISYESEGERRPRRLDEDPSTARLKDAYYVPYDRVQKTSEVFADLAKNKFLARTYFGFRVEEAIDSLLQARNDVLSSSDVLMDDIGSGDQDEEMKRIRKEARLTIYSRTKGDPLRPKIDNAVVTIDTECGGYLKSLTGG